MLYLETLAPDCATARVYACSCFIRATRPTELLQHLARIRGGDQRLGVRLQQKALRNRLAGGGFDRSNVAGVVDVALLQRRPRIFVRGALGLGLGEWNHAARIVADVALVKARCGDVPAEIGAERRIA